MRTPRYLLSMCIALAAASMLMFASSCHKRTTPDDVSFAADHATSEETFNDVQSISDNAADVDSGASLNFRTAATTIGGCATVTRTPGQIVINFGSGNCTCHDGRTRRGKIIITFTGQYADSGSVHTITFDNFYQNNNKVTGSKTVTNMGHNVAGQPYFNVVENGSVTRGSGGTISASWTRTRTWTQGFNTPDRSDDVYEITGSGTLTRANGNIINIAITKALVVATDCNWIKAGTVTFAMNSESRILNYGDTPNCDDQATVTLANGQVKNITLP